MKKQEFIFLWSWRNEEHIAKHDVEPAEAEYVVGHAQPPYPEARADEKLVVRGATVNGRHLQAIFVFVLLEDVQPEEFERLDVHQIEALSTGDPALRIIHARDLTQPEKRRLRRRRRT
jgi:hypothetical protein